MTDVLSIIIIFFVIAYCTAEENNWNNVRAVIFYLSNIVWALLCWRMALGL